MEASLKLAENANSIGEVPVGAVVVESSTRRIISKAYNQVESKSNAILHAEIIALSKAAKKLGTKYLNNCDLYVTLEPCPMCAAAISLFKIKSVYYGASDNKMGAIDSASNFFESLNCYHRPDVYSGIYEEKSSKLLKDFFKSVRSEKIHKE